MKPGGYRAGAALLRRRVEVYAAYGQLLKQQEEAVNQGDFDALASLDGQLDELERLLGDLPGVPPVSPDDGAEIVDLRIQAARALEAASRTQARLSQVLRRRRDDAREELRGLEGRDRQMRSYLEGDRPAGRVDVRL